MSSAKTLTVRVHEELVLDAGRWEETCDEEGRRIRTVHPPNKTLFEQVLAFLSSREGLPEYPPLRIGEEGVAATAVCLRWGSYLAVLTDREKPLWREARASGVSRIDDGEMARVNIEASAALAQWIDLMRQEPDLYRRLVWAAAGRHLPMTSKKARRDPALLHLLGLTQPDIAKRMISVVQNGRWAMATAEVKAHPTRVLANALIHTCWRNGPIEEIHAGSPSPYPLCQRRLTPSEERRLMRRASERLAQGMFAVSALVQEESERSWWEKVLPFQLSSAWLVTPTGWSLEEKTRRVSLNGRESATPGKA